jgi:flagellar basal body rod protein FlgC
VNLTTEMVGKFKAQLSYNANASVMKTANQMTETLLDIFV